MTINVRSFGIETYDFYYYEYPTGDGVEVPEGFLTDFGSIPQFAWWFIDPMDPDLMKSFLIHDWGYVEERRGPASRREYWDKVMLESALVKISHRYASHKVTKRIRKLRAKLKAYVAYGFVRSFGWWGWYDIKRRFFGWFPF